MSTTTTTRTGSRPPLPASLKNCASCGEPRGNRTADWTPILRAGVVKGYACPSCPRPDEPIRREVSRSGAVRWRAVIDATPPGAPKRVQAARRFDQLTDAREWISEARQARAEGRRIDASAEQTRSETVSELCARWLASRVDIRPVTIEGYKFSLAPVLHHLGDREVSTLAASDMRELVGWLSVEGGRPTHKDGLRRPLAPRSVRASMVALAQVLDLGVQDGLLARNVARGVKRPRQAGKVGSDLEHWRPDELLTFRQHADSDPLAAMWRLSLSGLTRADICGLRWSDLDLDRGTATIRQGRVQLQYGQAMAVDAPKSEQRRRTVPFELIHPGTVELLKSLKASQAAGRLKAGTAYSSTGFLVVDSLGVPIRPEVLSDRFKRLCADAGVPVIKLHSIRHSLAFWLHSLAVTPADAASLLGHTVEVHLSTYLPESGATGIAAAAAALGRAQRAAV